MYEKIDSFRLDHLGLPAQLASEIGFVDAIDNLAGIDGREIITTGQATLAMALNCLGFTTRALYITPQFFETRNLKFLLGESKTQPHIELHADHLNQHKLGRTLDRIAEIGPDRVFLEVALKAFRAEKVRVPSLHIDTTTHSFYGNYETPEGDALVGILGEESDEPVHISITHGYSKDHRSDCKQVVQELLVSKDGDVPLMFKAFSGNANDSKIMQERVAELKESLVKAKAEDLMPEHFVGDSKLYSKSALEDAKRDGVIWVTRVPASVKEVKQVIESALDRKADWLKSDLSKGLEYQSFIVTKHDIPQRFIVVSTEASRKRAEKSLKREVEKEHQLLSKEFKRLKKRKYSCIPDLASDADLILSKAKYHRCENLSFREAIQPKAPSKLAVELVENPEVTFCVAVDLKFLENEESIQHDKLANACFVIGTNDVREDVNPETILQVYMKDQQGVERAFRFLKDPEYFADAFFLKNPARVAALLCVMTLALLLFSLIQRKLRLSLVREGKTIPNQLGKPTKKPTLRWVNQHFEGIDVTRLTHSGGVKYVFHRIADFEHQVFSALGESYGRRYSEEFIS